jgi:hypothetical protein
MVPTEGLAWARGGARGREFRGTVSGGSPGGGGGGGGVLCGGGGGRGAFSGASGFLPAFTHPAEKRPAAAPAAAQHPSAAAAAAGGSPQHCPPKLPAPSAAPCPRETLRGHHFNANLSESLTRVWR